MPDTQNFTAPAPHVPMPLGGLVHRAIPHALNLATAPFNQKAIHADQIKLAGFEKQLQALAKTMPQGQASKIPSILHFIYGLKKREAFPYYAKLAVLSALHHNPGWQTIFHFREEPFGPHWESLRPHLILNPVPDFNYFGIAPLTHYAHKADVVRLLALLHVGGAYLDIDTLTQKSFAPLQADSFVMGIQRALPGQPGGLCNAIMLGAPHAAFTKMWLKQHRHFRSRGTDWLWDYMSVKTPALLARKKPTLITVLKPEAFFDPLWNEVETVLFSEQPPKSPLPNFAFHLWNNMIGAKLESIDADYVRSSNSLYAQIARPVAKAAGEI